MRNESRNLRQELRYRRLKSLQGTRKVFLSTKETNHIHNANLTNAFAIGNGVIRRGWPRGMVAGPNADMDLAGLLQRR